MPSIQHLIMASIPPVLTLTQDQLTMGTVKLETKTGIYYTNNQMSIDTLSILPRSDLLILLLLVRKLDMVATKNEILDTGWQNKVVSTSSICVSIHNIRNLLKLAGVSEQYRVKNFSGIGYGLFKIK